MKLGVVIGNVVASKKAGQMDGLKMLVVRYLNEQCAPTAHTAACVDTVGAGPGDVVLLCSSSSARVTAATKNAATDNTIVAIVDGVSTGGRYQYEKSSREK